MVMLIEAIDREMNNDGYRFVRKVDGFRQVSKDGKDWEYVDEGTHYGNVVDTYCD